METQGKLLEKVVLENGLEVHFIDQSRPVVGDRCLVQLLIDIPIPLGDEIFRESQKPEATTKAFLAAFGSTLHYRLTKMRHFVPKGDVDTVLSELKHEFTSAGLSYLGHPGFGRRFVLKTYEEWAEKERCRLAHMQAVSSAESGGPSG